tara:strand:- start:18306 stop:19409 length:1104 start_codon:yes stop_codon:yes gene_type:complete
MVSKLVTSSIVSATSTDLTLQASTGKKVKFKVGASGPEMSLPSADGTANQFMQTDGNGNLGFATVNSEVQSATAKYQFDNQTMQGPILLRVWDYDKHPPSENLQQIDMLVPNDFIPYNRISSFIIKWYNVNFSFKNGINSQNTVWAHTFVKPLDYEGNSLVHNNTNFRIRSGTTFVNGSSSWNSNYDNTSNGKNGQWTRSGGNPAYYTVEDVGYRIIRGDNTQIGIVPSTSSQNTMILNQINNPWSVTSTRNNNHQANFSGECIIHNRQSSWRATTNFNYQGANSWYNNGYPAMGTNQMGQDADNSTSNYYFMNSNYAAGVKLSMLPHQFTTANNGSSGSSGQVTASHWGISGGRFEFWINIVPASY